METSNHVVVVGGGIAGLTAAYRLQQIARAADRPLRVSLLEGDTRLGGKILTERADGFIIEGGPDIFLARKPWGVALCRELGLDGRLQGTNLATRRSYIRQGGELYPLPEGLSGLIPTRLGPLARTPLIPPLGKLRLALDFVLPARPDDGDEPVADFISRRLGRQAYDRLIEPLMGGIYAGDGRQLSLAATFPQLRQLEVHHGGLIKGLWAQQRNGQGQGANSGESPFVSLQGGMAEVVEVLFGRLEPGTVATGARVVSIEASAGGYVIILADGRRLAAAAVILATPAYVTAEVLAGLAPAASAALAAIPYVSTATVSVAYRLADVPRPLDGYGYVVPRAEGGEVVACTWSSSKLAKRAPEEYALIRVFVGRAGQEAAVLAGDDDLLRMVRAELRQTLGITAGPLFHRIYRWPKAMPQYNLGHLERLGQIERSLAQHPGLCLAGAAYRGVGIPDCIHSGEAAAKATFDYLAQGET